MELVSISASETINKWNVSDGASSVHQIEILNFYYPNTCIYANNNYFCRGELAEWSIAAVLKTVVPQGTVGSNPTFSAKTKKASRKAGFFYYQ